MKQPTTATILAVDPMVRLEWTDPHSPFPPQHQYPTPIHLYPSHHTTPSHAQALYTITPNLHIPIRPQKRTVLVECLDQQQHLTLTQLEAAVTPLPTQPPNLPPHPYTQIHTHAPNLSSHTHTHARATLKHPAQSTPSPPHTQSHTHTNTSMQQPNPTLVLLLLTHTGGCGWA